MRRRQRKIIFVLLSAAFFLCGMTLGVVRTELFLDGQHSRSLTGYAGDKVHITGTVVDDIDRRDTSLRATIRVEEVNGALVPKHRQGKIIAILQRDTPVAYGDHVSLSGALVLPESFETNTGHIFNYPKYLQVRGISALVKYATIDAISPGNFSIIGSLFFIKHTFEHSLERVFTEPQGALVEGILLGERRGLPDDLSHTFVVSGLVHVVVLSGYNISIVAEWVLRAFSFLPQAIGFVGGVVVIILFALMTGGSATAVRACIMSFIAILGRVLNRPTDALRALVAAVLLMVLWNPLSLLYDPSFILSVLATFGLITISPSVEHLLRWMPEKFGVRSIAASTISVQLFVLPALLYFTGVLSFVSLPANILALPVVPLAMLGGFVAGVLGLAHPLLAIIPAFVSDMLLRYMILVAHFATAIPFSSAAIPAFSAWIVAILYVPLTGVAVWLYRRSI